jgi:hypothetical protein
MDEVELVDAPPQQINIPRELLARQAGTADFLRVMLRRYVIMALCKPALTRLNLGPITVNQVSIFINGRPCSAESLP